MTKEIEAKTEFQPQREAVVFVFFKDNKVLVEKRAKGNTFEGLKIFPSGKVEVKDIDGDLDYRVEALRREVWEELGVIPTKFRLILAKVYPREVNMLLHCFLITEWQGQIETNRVAEKGVFEWMDLSRAEKEMPLESSKEIIASAKSVLEDRTF
jgi:8-oxo-dGTP pyrophosphatase MutT (NUDIX family)